MNDAIGLCSGYLGIYVAERVANVIYVMNVQKEEERMNGIGVGGGGG